MSITPEQLAKRRDFITSSEAHCLFDDPATVNYGNRRSLYWEKTEDLEPLQENDAMEAGNLLEPAVLDWTEKQFGEPIERDADRLEFTKCRAMSHPDGLFRGNPIEAKSHAIYSGFVDPAWGSPGTDLIPKRHLWQCHMHMATMPEAPDGCYVPALISGRGFQMYWVDYSERISAALLAEVEAFWRDHIEPRIEPDGPPPPMECLRRVKREPESVGEVPEEIFTAWDKSCDALDLAKGREARDKAEVMAAMGNNEAAWIGNGQFGALTLYARKRGSRSLRHKSSGL